MKQFYFYSCLLLLYSTDHCSAIQIWKDSVEIGLNKIDAACLEPKLTGPCRAKVPRYHYNGVSQECEIFSYGGCGGNENNFESLEECNDRCARPVEQEKKSICQGPPQSGPNCEAIIPRWTFNTSTQECVQFIFNGCGATGNHFHDQLQCQLQCGDTSSCLLPKDPGPCYAQRAQWWFDGSKGECAEFIYGGCGGNSNRYRSRMECEAVCRPFVKMQRLERSKSTCDGIKCPEGISHYTELGCKPIYDDGACCPTRFECPERQIEKNMTQCSYKNKIYNSLDSIPAADSGLGCRAACICNNGEITCASIECPELFGYFPKPGCGIGLYKPDSCCAYDYACGNETTICDFDGRKYVEGQKMYPLDEPCLVCFCKAGFNGTLSSEYCKRIDCGVEIYYSKYLQKGCTPVYFENADGHIGCCPISWRCPEDEKEMSTGGWTDLQLNSSSSVTSNATDLETKGLVQVTRVIPFVKSNYSCTDPKVEGDCQAKRPRYFYNSSSNECELFEYTGCGGNNNNFQSLRQCISLCVNSTTGEEEESSLILSRLAPVKMSVTTVTLVASDPCTEEARTGRCRAYFRRWFFDPRSNTCKLFIYGGCQRNGNNFYTRTSCEATCVKEYPNVCGSKPEDLYRDCGLRNSTKFYYDAEEGYCKRFSSTGCSGQNVFNRLVDCHTTCGVGSSSLALPAPWGPPIIPVVAPVAVSSSSSSGSNEDICLLPRQAGACLGNVPSYYYDVMSKSCKSFSYGGCFGNQNRFAGLEDCRRTCEGIQHVGMAGKNQASIDFAGLPQVDDPNVMKWPSSAAKRDTQSQPPGSEDGVSERSPDGVNSIITEPEDNNSGFIFSRMFNLNAKPTDSSETAEKSEETVSPLELIDDDDDDDEETVQKEQDLAEQSSFHRPQVESPNVMGQGELIQISSATDTDSFNRPQVEDPNVMGKSASSLEQLGDSSIEKHSSSFSRPQVESPNLMRPTEFQLGQSGPRHLQDACTLEKNEGTCNQTILRFHWDGSECRPFNYTGCGGNKNRFVTEYDCKRTCSDNFEDLAKDLYCVYGDRVIPYGGSLDETEECGSQYCTCIVPPSLTCTVKAC